MLIILIVFPLNNDKLATCFKFHIVGSKITVTQSGPKSMNCSHGRNILISHSSKSQKCFSLIQVNRSHGWNQFRNIFIKLYGLSDDAKRNAVFSKLKRSAAGIYLLQETHSTPKMEQRWQHEWGNKNMYFSHGASNSRGVAIMITNNYDANIVKLNESQKSQCEGLMTESELLKSIKTFKNGKTPGTDGLTAEFYKFFWNDIKDLLLSSINFALQYGRLSTEQRRGIISLLPKKDKDRLYLKNWRPISLLNVDYKILAKALGNRIISFLRTLINEDQTGYIKKRFIGNNIRIIEDILLYTNKNKVTGILLTIDFEKAFDSLKWGFLKKCLQAFNFGQRFVSYINVLYSDISAAVLNNGHISRWFYPEKGVRQGCPLSPYLFILAVETLSCKIRDSKNVRGIQIDNCEIKIT